MKLHLTPAAEADVRQIDSWYGQQSKRLARVFRGEVDHCLSRIRRAPKAHPMVYGEMRRALLRRFPYGVFYVIGDKEIGLLGVFHGKRDPTIWRSRYDT